MTIKNGNKSFGLHLAKAQGPAETSDAQLALINKFTLSPLTKEQVYVRPIHLCHNAIDHDRERFSEALLKDFLATAPGKTFTCSHRTDSLGFGILFDGEILKMTPADASALLGEDLRFPAEIKEAQILKLWFYVPVSVQVGGKQVEMNQEFVANIEAGVFRHVSIGLSAHGCVAVVDEKSGDTLYWEWKAPGYLREASLVYLGAQPGATTAAKSAGVKDIPEAKNDEPTKEKRPMEKLKALLGLGADAAHAEVEKAFSRKMTRLAFLESLISPLVKAFGDAEPTAEGVKALVLEAADGRVYKSALVDEALKLERMAKKLGDDEKSLASRKGMLTGRPVADLLFDLDSLRKSASSLTKTVITGSEPNAGRSEGGRKSFIRKEGDSE